MVQRSNDKSTETLTISIGDLILTSPKYPQRLSDLHIIVRSGFPLDQGIKDLLKSLIFYGIKTESSCDGGIDHIPRGSRHGKRPWIEVTPTYDMVYVSKMTDDYVNRLKPLVDAFNAHSEIRWIFEKGLFGTALTTEKAANNVNSLETLSRSSTALAEFVFNAKKLSDSLR